MPFSHEYPQSSLVRIKQNGSIIGLGLLMDDEIVLTCAHVVARALGIADETPEMPAAPLTLDFPYLKTSCGAHVIHWMPPLIDEYAGEIGDVAVLRLDSKKPQDALPTPLTPARPLPGHQFKAIGYPKGYENHGASADGVIRDLLPSGRLQIESLSVNGVPVQEGFSGTPVWDKDLKGVVGIVAGALKGNKVGFIIPTEELCRIWSRLPLSPPPGLSEVPALPEQFVDRPVDLAKMKQMLLRDIKQPAGYQKIAVQGMGGSGKSVLSAALLLKDQEVQQFFPDGIFWIRLGKDAGTKLLQKQLSLAQALGDKRGFQDVEAGRERLLELFGERRVLIVLDDLWEHEHFLPFDALGPNCRMMVTTRDLALVKEPDFEEKNVHKLGLLDDAQSGDLLAMYAGQRPDPAIEINVIKECGGLPLALAMVGSMIKSDSQLPWKEVLDMLRDADLEEIKKRFRDYPYPDLLKAIQVSVMALEPEDQALYTDFAVFPEDTPIPEDVLKVFWRHRGLPDYKIRQKIARFFDLSLATADGNGRIVLHDLLYDYVKRRAKDLKALHSTLLEAYSKVCPDGWHNGPNEGYFYQHLAYHLTNAGRIYELKSLLFDFNWLEAKLFHTDIGSLISDFNWIKDDNDLTIVQRSLKRSANSLAADKSQLSSQLYGRLFSQKSEKIKLLLEKLDVENKKPWLRTRTSFLDPISILESTLKGNLGSIKSLAITPDGKYALSSSNLRELKIWDIDAGKELKIELKNQPDFVCNLLIFSDVSGFFCISDKCIFSVDLKTGRGTGLVDYPQLITNIALSSDGKLAAISAIDKSNTLILWDIENKNEDIIGKHPDYISAIAITPDGSRVVSGSSDGTLILWDLAGKERNEMCLDGHKARINAIMITPDGSRALSGSSDGTLIIWDLKNKSKKPLSGHISSVNAIALAKDGKIAMSASEEYLKIWDTENGKEIWTRKIEKTNAIAIDDEGHRAVSASNSDIFVWDLKNLDAFPEIRPPEMHTERVMAISMSQGNKGGRETVSLAWDGDLKLWHTKTGSPTNVNGNYKPDKRKSAGKSIAITPDGRYAVSGYYDSMMIVWDLSGDELPMRTWIEPIDNVYWINQRDMVAITPDGKYVLSISNNKVKLWKVGSEHDPKSKERDLPDQRNLTTIKAIAITNKKAVIALIGNAFKIWDFEDPAVYVDLVGESNQVNQVALSSDGRYAISVSKFDKGNIQLWNLEEEKEPRFFNLNISENIASISISEDGRVAALIDGKDKIKIIDLEGKGDILATITADHSIEKDNLLVCAINTDRIISIGEESGQVHFLHLENFDQ